MSTPFGDPIDCIPPVDLSGRPYLRMVLVRTDGSREERPCPADVFETRVAVIDGRIYEKRGSDLDGRKLVYREVPHGSVLL